MGAKEKKINLPRRLPVFLNAKWIAGLFLRLYFHLEIHGQEHEPKSGPVLIVANHKTNFDPILIGCFIKRPPFIMAKQELFAGPLGLFFGWLGAFPIHRGTFDRQAFRSAMEVLDHGEPLILFPEGRRIRGPELGEAQAGAVYILMKSGAPVFPIAIKSDFKPFAKVVVSMGEPVHLPKNMPRQEVGPWLMQQIGKLYDAIEF